MREKFVVVGRCVSQRIFARINAERRGKRREKLAKRVDLARRASSQVTPRENFR